MECLCLSDGVTLQHVMRWGERWFIRCTSLRHSGTRARCTLSHFNEISVLFERRKTLFSDVIAEFTVFQPDGDVSTVTRTRSPHRLTVL